MVQRELDPFYQMKCDSVLQPAVSVSARSSVVHIIPYADSHQLEADARKVKRLGGVGQVNYRIHLGVN